MAMPAKVFLPVVSRIAFVSSTNRTLALGHAAEIAHASPSRTAHQSARLMLTSLTAPESKPGMVRG